MKTRKTTTVTRPRKHPKPSTLLAALAAMTLAGAPLMANETAFVTGTQTDYTGGGYATPARNATQATQARQAIGYVSPYSPSSSATRSLLRCADGGFPDSPELR